MASKRLGETKGPFIMWLFVTLYFAIPMLFAGGGSSGGTLPQNFTLSLAFNLIISMVIGWGGILVFLVAFLAVREKRGSLRQIFSSVGLRKTGSFRSLLWSLGLFPLCAVIGLVSLMLVSFIGPLPTGGSNSGQVPFWYLLYMVIYSFFPVAVIEETVARGYLLDRLMPEHPSSLAKALPAIILSSVLFTLYHVPGYLRVYSLPVAWAVGRLAINVFPLSIVLCIVYVRARTRNVIGLVLVHFLLDALPFVLSFV
jgi:membrane protease YdiL (CAAX protease family)